MVGRKQGPVAVLILSTCRKAPNSGSLTSFTHQEHGPTGFLPAGRMERRHSEVNKYKRISMNASEPVNSSSIAKDPWDERGFAESLMDAKSPLRAHSSNAPLELVLGALNTFSLNPSLNCCKRDAVLWCILPASHRVPDQELDISHGKIHFSSR